ncbi:MAG: tetratricopeptide repeat protein [Acaryochloris sp. RU_4_1]|nr:tetratricopeptide repeat protein [Acaryochloris sp. RU_4_1]
MTSKNPNVKASLKTVWRVASAAIVVGGLWAGSVLAKDPFRTTNPKPISDNTSAAFEALFKQGNYKAATTYLSKLDPNEPLALSMKASLTYSSMQGLSKEEKDKKSAILEEFKSYATQTRSAAEKLRGSDPLRGNLYLAVSHFFDGVYTFTKEGAVKGAPQVLNELQQIMKYLDAAQVQSPNDPELNLLRGYIDVYTGVYLPFSNATKGLERLEKYAGPRYLAERGLAMGYLEMKDYDKAIAAVDRARQLAPDNPELEYLKARILVKQGKDQESLSYFEKALSKKEQNQLPLGLVKEMERAQRKTKERVAGVGK